MQSRAKKPAADKVSIPNGMEFYSVGARIYAKNRKVSIPNGMKFYPSYQFNKNLLHCFNSQRDEILHDYCENIRGEDAEFQFPTGWNSTVYIKVKEIDSNGFNSQRDEILRAAEKIRLANQAGFNSQRDGILHEDKIKSVSKIYMFQFPTGWNSTFWVTPWSQSACVSIPNGMEFYYFFIGFDKPVFEFQFPTGWNSTEADAKNQIELQMFQFPTGWNSTLATLTISTTWKSFNSQRDGILHKKCLLLRDEAEFQFPTGWNSTQEKAH